MAFLIHSTDDGHVVPLEYLPAEAGTYKVGEALAIDTAGSHQLDTSTAPTHICMADKVVANAGELLPCVRITDDIIFESVLSADGTVNVGSIYWVTSDGLEVAPTGTASANKFTLDYAAGAVAGDIVRGRFPQ